MGSTAIQLSWGYPTVTSSRIFATTAGVGESAAKFQVNPIALCTSTYRSCISRCRVMPALSQLTCRAYGFSESFRNPNCERRQTMRGALGISSAASLCAQSFFSCVSKMNPETIAVTSNYKQRKTNFIKAHNSPGSSEGKPSEEDLLEECTRLAYEGLSNGVSFGFRGLPEHASTSDVRDLKNDALLLIAEAHEVLDNLKKEGTEEPEIESELNLAVVEICIILIRYFKVGAYLEEAVKRLDRYNLYGQDFPSDPRIFLYKAFMGTHLGKKEEEDAKKKQEDAKEWWKKYQETRLPNPFGPQG